MHWQDKVANVSRAPLKDNSIARARFVQCLLKVTASRNAPLRACSGMRANIERGQQYQGRSI
jgi:hypothetical protein